MATYYFLNDDADGNWSNGNNWNEESDGSGASGTVPGSSDDAVVLQPVSNISSGSAVVTNLTVEGSGSITNITVTATSTLIQSGGSLGTGGAISGPVTVGSGGVIGGSIMSVATVTGALTFSGSGSTTSGNSGTVVSVSTDVIFSANWTGTAEYISAGVNVIFNYGYSGSASNLTVTGSTLYAGFPTLYYSSGGMDFNWNTLSNWYVDSGHTQQASSIPDSTQDVILNSDVTSDSSAGAVANNLTVNYNGMNSGKLWISITVTTLTTFSTDTYYGDSMNSRTLTSPTVTFNGNSYLNSSSSIVGDVNFYDTSSNLGSITGDVTVYSTHAVPFDSSHGNTGTISGTISYSGYSSRTVYFYHTGSSESWTDINYWYNGSGGTGGNADYVPDGAISLDDVIIEATPFDSTSTNRIVKTLTVNQNPTTFNSPYIYNNIVITCDYANFNDSTYNDGTIYQSSNHSSNRISFNDLSSNSSTGFVEPWTPDSIPVKFQDSATNDGTIDGDAEVYYPSEKPIGGTVNGTVTYYGYTLYFGGVSNDGDWNNPNNWFLDISQTNAYNNTPSEIIPYQDVVIAYNLTSYGGAGTPSANNLNTYGTYPSISNINILVDNLATFSQETYLDATATITGDVLFENLATNRGGTITGTGTFTLTAAAEMIDNAYSGTYGNIEFQYGKGVNGSNILGIV